MEEWVTIRELAHRKVPLSEIARRTGFDRKTVRKVLLAPAPKPHGNTGKNKQGKLDPYREYLLERVDQGCLNGTVLLHEIKRQGYAGGVSILRDLLTPIRREQVRKQEATGGDVGPGSRVCRPPVRARPIIPKNGRQLVPEVTGWASFGRAWQACK